MKKLLHHLKMAWAAFNQPEEEEIPRFGRRDGDPKTAPEADLMDLFETIAIQRATGVEKRHGGRDIRWNL